MSRDCGGGREEGALPGNGVRLILASRSPRRRRILESLGLVFEVVAPEVEEIDWPNDPDGMVRENAWRKWRWCRARHHGAAILAADTTVDLGGRVLGKPSSRAEAAAMLRECSGRDQVVHTGYVLSLPDETAPVAAVETSVVRFHVLTDAVIEAYLEAVNPMDRAGAYDIDHHGDWIVSGFRGSRTNIMGLPAERIKEWMECRLARWR